MALENALKFDSEGLLTAVVTDAADGALLMVAHMNLEALRLTLTTGFATFWSRSRQELWEKGATSGNRMRVLDLRLDCDGDAVQIVVEPAGPACHTGVRSCFFRRLGPQGPEPL
jgi:phosphoribosyl-AMP cyclohydrolase